MQRLQSFEFVRLHIFIIAFNVFINIKGWFDLAKWNYKCV